MTTTLVNCKTELSKQLDDYWASTTTSDGSTTPFVTLTDTALKAKSEQWITDNTYVMLTEEPEGGTTQIYEERKVSTLSASGTLTFLAFTEKIVSGINYEIHRLFTPSAKRQALIYAARAGFPWIHEKIWDESIVSGNWLKDGSLELWPTSSTLTYWSKTGSVSLNEATLSPYYKHGKTSCLMDTATGSLYQAIGDNDDLKRLAGKAVTFTLQGHSDTADSLRISIYDGSTLTYSDHTDDDTAWTRDAEPLSVTATIQDHPNAIEFRIHHDIATAADYVDDARVICAGTNPRLFIDHLGLAQETPHQVFIEPSNYSLDEPWTLIHSAEIDTENGYLYLPSSIPNNRRLRIRGLGYLDFLVSGVSSTAWTSAININKPQTDILVAQAALYLYTRMAMPNFSSGDRKDFQEMMGFWKQELRERIGKHGMDIPSVPTKWR